jgi:hypothetical protein
VKSPQIRRHEFPTLLLKPCERLVGAPGPDQLCDNWQQFSFADAVGFERRREVPQAFGARFAPEFRVDKAYAWL